MTSSLVLIVGFATNESRAKEIGENFVRYDEESS